MKYLFCQRQTQGEKIIFFYIIYNKMGQIYKLLNLKFPDKEILICWRVENNGK